MLYLKVICNIPRQRVLVALAILILTACSNQTSQNDNTSDKQPAVDTSDYYLQQVQQNKGNSKIYWQLLAIRTLLNEGKSLQATQEINQISGQLSHHQQHEFQLLKAQSAIATQDDSRAQTMLDALHVSDLALDQQPRYWQLLIAIHQNHPSLALLRAYVAQELVLQGNEKQKNIDATWQTLMQMTPEQIRGLVINANENILQGWLDLLNAYHASRDAPDTLMDKIRDWKTRYPQNPAAKTLPSSLNTTQPFHSSSGAKIALLLPMSGQAQTYANAILKGFNDAKNGLLNTVSQPTAIQPADNVFSAMANQQAPSEEHNAAINPSVIETTISNENVLSPQNENLLSPNAVEVNIYDTQSQPLNQLLAQVQQDGATLVIGPLLKSDVEKLVDSPRELNVLALNAPEQIQYRPNLCYFALSPEDEARDAAQHIWNQGKHSPLLLVPHGTLGNRVSVAFATEWQKLGGRTVLEQEFGSTAELNHNINNGQGIRLGGSPINVMQRQNIKSTEQNFPTLPNDESIPLTTSASDGVDAVYVVASQSELQLIQPMIAMLSSSRDHVALYASSRSFQTETNADYRFEMENLQFSDIPLLTGAHPSLMQQAAKVFNNNYSLIRLYAMGIDAWTLANHFNELHQHTNFQIDAYTGTLSANQNCVITRKLTWSRFRHGRITPVI